MKDMELIYANGDGKVRLWAVRKVLWQKEALTKVASKVGVHYTTIADWVERYRKGGVEALNVPRKPIAKVNVDVEKLKAFAQNSDEKTKRQIDIIIRIAEGENLQDVAKSDNLTPQGIIKFRKAILKKLDGFQYGPIKIKQQEIKKETSHNLQKVKELHTQGLNNTEIAKHLHKTNQWVSWILKKHGLKTNRPKQIEQKRKREELNLQKRKKERERKRKKIAFLYSKGFSAKSISTQTGVKYATVISIISRMKLEKHRNPDITGENSYLAKLTNQEIVDLYESFINDEYKLLDDIAKEFEITKLYAYEIIKGKVRNKKHSEYKARLDAKYESVKYRRAKKTVTRELFTEKINYPVPICPICGNPYPCEHTI